MLTLMFNFFVFPISIGWYLSTDVTPTKESLGTPWYCVKHVLNASHSFRQVGLTDVAKPRVNVPLQRWNEMVKMKP